MCIICCFKYIPLILKALLHSPSIPTEDSSLTGRGSTAGTRRTIRAFSRRHYPEPITISTRQKKEKQQYISVVTVRLFVEPREGQALTITRLTHSPYTTKIARIRCDVYGAKGMGVAPHIPLTNYIYNWFASDPIFINKMQTNVVVEEVRCKLVPSLL